MTGTTSGYSYFTRENYNAEREPLGQEVLQYDPTDDDIGVPPANETINFWQDMQWQCEIGDAFYGGFWGMPFHCQMNVLQSGGGFLGDLLRQEEKNPQRIIITDSPIPKFDPPFNSPSETILTYALKSTSKKDKKDKKKKCPVENGEAQCEEVAIVTTKIPEAPEIPDFRGADVGTDFPERKLSDNEVARLRNNVDLLLRNGTCANFVQNLLSVANKLFPKVEMSSDYILGVFDQVVQQNGFSLGNSIAKSYGFAGSTVHGSLKDGTAEVELAASYQKVDVYKPMKGSFATRRNIEVMNLQRSINAAVTTIHELMHLIGYGDHSLALALATMNEDQEYLTRGKVTVREASDYWGGMKGLKKNCWVDANKLVK